MQHSLPIIVHVCVIVCTFGVVLTSRDSNGLIRIHTDSFLTIDLVFAGIVLLHAFKIRSFAKGSLALVVSFPWYIYIYIHI